MDIRGLKPTVVRPSPPESHHTGLEQLAWLMDRAFRIPGTPIRVGLDSIIGLIPGGGDVLMGDRPGRDRPGRHVPLPGPSGRGPPHGGQRPARRRHRRDPFVGDAFDIFFKANTRNLNLLREVEQTRAQQKTYPSTSSLFYLLLIAGGFLLVLGLMLIGLVAVIAWILSR